jgi:hypothetical protein
LSSAIREECVRSLNSDREMCHFAGPNWNVILYFIDCLPYCLGIFVHALRELHPFLIDP